MRAFLVLLVAGVLLSIVGSSVEGLLWLTVPGVLAFLGAVAYAVLSPPPPERDVTSRHATPRDPELLGGRREAIRVCGESTRVT